MPTVGASVQDSSSPVAGGVIAAAAVVIVAAMLFTGLEGGGLLPLVVQTSPLWLLMVFGWRGGGYARWAGAPLLAFWIILAALDWADRLGWSHIPQSVFVGFDGPEAAVVGVAGLAGLAACCTRAGRASPMSGMTLALACGALQIGAFYLGMQPDLFAG